jgi:hypothetical protein
MSFLGWKEEDDQNFHETGFIKRVVRPAGIYRCAI